jgi:hypothetical protein
MIHRLKTIQPYYGKVRNKQKRFEIRKADREFKVGDTLILQEYDPILQTYSGRECAVKVLYILTDAKEYGLMDGYCLMSISSPLTFTDKP